MSVLGLSHYRVGPQKEKFNESKIRRGSEHLGEEVEG
jgi:hypothetical protein